MVDDDNVDLGRKFDIDPDIDQPKVTDITERTAESLTIQVCTSRVVLSQSRRLRQLFHWTCHVTSRAS